LNDVTSSFFLQKKLVDAAKGHAEAVATDEEKEKVRTKGEG